MAVLTGLGDLKWSEAAAYTDALNASSSDVALANVGAPVSQDGRALEQSSIPSDPLATPVVRQSPTTRRSHRRSSIWMVRSGWRCSKFGCVVERIGNSSDVRTRLGRWDERRSERASRSAIRDAKFAAEDARVVALAAGLRLSAAERAAIEDAAVRLVEQVRARRGEHSVLDVFLKEFGLANEEGVALMCLAEALLRIPDAATVDALIADKILPGRWADHIGNSESTFVNASTWALMLTGRVIALDQIRVAFADGRAGPPGESRR